MKFKHAFEKAWFLFFNLMKSKIEQDPDGDLDKLYQYLTSPDQGDQQPESSNPSEMLDRVDILARLLNELNSFNPSYYQIVNLRIIDGLTLRETSQEIGKAVTTVHRLEKEAIEWLQRNSNDFFYH